MNKIVVEQKEFSVENKNIIIKEFKNTIQDLHIIGKVNLGILTIPQNFVLNIYLHEQAILNIDLFVHLNNIKNQFNIYSKYQSKLNFHYSCIFDGNNFLNIYNFIQSDETEANVYVRAVENNGTFEIKAEGSVLEKTKENIYLEDIKALTNHNHCIKIQPNLLVKSNQVIANHNMTISNINHQELWYLESKGLNRSVAIDLLKTGFLKGILNLEEIKQEVKSFE